MSQAFILRAARIPQVVLGVRWLGYIGTLCALVLISVPTAVIAEGIRYMDQAGNIHFVDRLAEVPEEYRGQVINVEPTPMTQEQYRKALQEYRRKQSQAKKEAQRAEREAAKLERQRQRELKQAEKRASKQKREVQRVERPAKPTPAPKVTQVPARPVNQTITR